MSALLPTAAPRQTWRAVWDLVRARPRLAVVAGLTLVLGTGVGLLAAPLLGLVVDAVIAADPGALTWPVVALGAVALVSGVATAVSGAKVARLGESVLADLRERFLGAALDLPLARVEAAGAGDLTARASRDVGVVADAVRTALPTLARSAVTIVLSLVGMAVLDWRFLIAGVLAAPVQLHTVRWYARNARKVYAEQRIAVGAQQQQLLESVEGARTVRAFGLRDKHTDLVAERSTTAVDLAVRGVYLLTRFYSRLNLAEFIGLTAVLVTGFFLVDAGEVTVGAATAAALYFHGIFNPINAVLGLADDLQLAAASLSRLVGLLLEPSERAEPRPHPGADLKLAGVHFGYDGTPVLRGVDLEVLAGERVALVGANGAGKTTLARLVAGVAEPDEGSITLGGVPVRPGCPVHLVSQEVHVFAGSVAEDLRLARAGATDDELRAALRAVGALDWVQALPDGLATRVGDGGHPLTAAEGQHLALARLVLADPPVVILDEATADAGSAGARVLERAADAALAGRTALVVAHRLTQAAAADRVVVLADGRVAEAGPHADLLAAGGDYARLWAAWSAPR
ncbi:ABC transporter ATP-binding protein [Actinokineospora bangkokensis]|uniref:Multidrug ABC transporter permease n=1 Tax=Actinokineospora bangkokensis TaxID=1193682 RepID=A0A1Q9LGY9_9PSEU|nr:ABC transporter ATP-binding protein [Actinokineospora bangkokensis]OLR91280.1 multidrug ABC transporter permease [Actinokineospora bangkokensis]